jgi:hypothetical protein
MLITAPLVVIGFISLFLLSTPAYAQQTDQIETPTDVTQTTFPVDAATIGTVVATAGGLLVKDRKDKKDLEKQLDMKEAEIARLNKEKQESDEIQDGIQVAMYKIFTAASIYPDKNLKEILDLKATNNPLEKNTLGEELAIQINRKVRWTNQVYNVPMPNMSVPSAQVINATTVVQANKVVEGQQTK